MGRTCRRCSPRSATLRMRTGSSPTCPSWTGSLARPKNPTKLQSQASRRPWQHGTLLKKIRQLPSPLGVTKQHQKQPKLRDLRNHLQTWLHITIKSKAEPGGSTLSRSIFAFLENRDNTNVDSNPTKTSMNLKNLAPGNF